MGQVVALTNLTLDGVMQAPGRPDEDRRGGFGHGGWGAPYGAMQEVDGGFTMGALLFGRWTYESFHAFWPQQTGSPFTEFLNNVPKYVVSTTLKEPLSWSNSMLLKGDLAAAVNRLKEERAEDIVVFGSGTLVQSLMRQDLVDKYVLLIHPLVLGSGRRLFPDGGAPAQLDLLDAKTTSTGVVVATYVPAGAGDERW